DRGTTVAATGAGARPTAGSSRCAVQGQTRAARTVRLQPRPVRRETSLPRRVARAGPSLGAMYATVASATVVGVDAVRVTVEVLVSGGLPSFTIVGLPGAAVQESRERVRAALKRLGHPLSPSRVTVNLAPADVRKDGP